MRGSPSRGRKWQPTCSGVVTSLGKLGDWMGEPGSQSWIEGFAISPNSLIGPQDIEYQAVLGKGWLSPWSEGGQYCGSRGMALPILGLRVRLKGPCGGHAMRCACSATFTDGSKVGPISDDTQTAEAESLAPLEAFRIEVLPQAGSAEAVMPAGTGGHRSRGRASTDASGRIDVRGLRAEAVPLKSGRAQAGKAAAPVAARSPAAKGGGGKPASFETRLGKTRTGKIRCGKTGTSGATLSHAASRQPARPVRPDLHRTGGSSLPADPRCDICSSIRISPASSCTWCAI